MFVISKKIKGLCASTLNEITASVRCVSITPVILYAKFPDRYTWTKEDSGKRTIPKKVLCLRGGTGTLNSCRSLDYARNNESVIYFNGLCKPMEIYICARKKYPFTSYPAVMHPKKQQICHYRHARKNQWTFLVH